MGKPPDRARTIAWVGNNYRQPSTTRAGDHGGRRTCAGTFRSQVNPRLPPLKASLVESHGQLLPGRRDPEPAVEGWRQGDDFHDVLPEETRRSPQESRQGEITTDLSPRTPSPRRNVAKGGKRTRRANKTRRVPAIRPLPRANGARESSAGKPLPGLGAGCGRRRRGFPRERVSGRNR